MGFGYDSRYACALNLFSGRHFHNGGTVHCRTCPIRFNGLPVSDERCGQFG